MGGREVESDTRIAGYAALRRETSRTILDRLSSHRPLRGARLLDVGSAYGWFLDEAERAGANASGIEPDPDVAERSLGTVRVGRFPEALTDEEVFDVIAFNDVLEHIPDVAGALQACASHLAPGGLLSVNIPTADGLAFRVACALARVGVRGPYERLWQRGLASPHLHYFATSALVRLISGSGFEILSVAPLPAIAREGLWQRVHTVRRPGISSVFAFVALFVASGVLNRPGFNDIVHVIARRAMDGDDGPVQT